MSKAAAFCNIIPDGDGAVASWVCAGLGIRRDELGACLALGFVLEKRPIGGLIYHGLQDGSVWWTIYTVDKRWCTRRVLRVIFGLAFDALGCHRINIIVSKSNVKSLKLVKGLGFVQEGILRKYRGSGEDCYIFGMLKSECKWLGRRERNLSSLCSEARCFPGAGS